MRPGPGGYVNAKLTAQGYATVAAVIDALAAPRPRAADGPDLRTAGHRRADALTEACRRLLAHDLLPATGKHRPQLVVTIGLDTLTGALGPARLGDNQRLSAGEVRRLACTADIIPAVLGTGSVPLDLGRRVRFFDGPQRRALDLRDQGCTFPGCSMAPASCDGHHIVAWQHGGRTDLSNAALLCGHHHSVIHHGDWAIQMGTDGRPEFLPPPWQDPHRHPRRNIIRLLT